MARIIDRRAIAILDEKRLPDGAAQHAGGLRGTLGEATGEIEEGTPLLVVPDDEDRHLGFDEGAGFHVVHVVAADEQPGFVPGLAGAAHRRAAHEGGDGRGRIVVAFGVRRNELVPVAVADAVRLRMDSQGRFAGLRPVGRRERMEAGGIGVLHAPGAGSEAGHDHRVGFTGDAADLARLDGAQVQPDAARHAPEGLQRMGVTAVQHGAGIALAAAGRRQPGKDPWQIVRTWRLAVGDVGPEQMPERALVRVPRGRPDERRQRSAATQRGAVAGATRGREGLQRVERHGGGRAPEERDAISFHQEIGIALDGILAGSVDEKSLDGHGFAGKVFEVLAESRAVAVEHEGMGQRREFFRQDIGGWRVVPPLRPGVLVLRRAGGREQADEQFEAGDTKIPARPIKVENRILSEISCNMVGLEESSSDTAAARKPSKTKKIRRFHGLYSNSFR